MKAVICGCGIAGLALARLLAGGGWDVVAVERSSGARGGDYAIDLGGPGFDVAEALGLVPELRRSALPIEEAAFVDSKGRPVATLDFRRLRQAARGRLVTVLRGDLERVLRGGLEGRIDLRGGCTVERFQTHQTGVSVTLSDGTRHAAHLLVGADGVHSRIRRLAFGETGAEFRYLGLHVAAYTFVDPGLDARAGHRFWVSDSVGRLLALYGLGQGRVGVLSLHRSPERVLPADPGALLRQVHASSARWAAAALEACPDPPGLFYDMAGQVVVPEWHRSHVVLVGDSCQAVSLVGGQGASLALAGAWALATALREVAGTEAGLVAYEERVRERVRAGQAAGRRTAAWFVPRSPTRLFIRRVGLRVLHLPWLSGPLMRTAFGDSRPGASWTG